MTQLIQSQRLVQRQTLNHAQKLQLKQLLRLEQRLKHPQFPDAARGLEGMQEAHKILQAHNSIGILIGGLAEAVWNKYRTKEELSEHKDVDVMVLDYNMTACKKFEGGVDWWLPQEERFTITSDYGRAENIKVTWWENVNQAVLSFTAKVEYDFLKPGLYIPSNNWVVQMRKTEASANISETVRLSGIDDEIWEAYEQKIRKRVHRALPKFIKDSFSEYILCYEIEPNLAKSEAVRLDALDLKTRGVVYKHIEQR